MNSPEDDVLTEEENQDLAFDLALLGISLTDRQREQARICWDQCPEGFERCVEKALRFDRPGGMLAGMLRRDKHLEPLYRVIDEDDGRTGWKFVRGSHSGTYVRDPEGRDKLPYGYDLTGYPD